MKWTLLLAIVLVLLLFAGFLFFPKKQPMMPNPLTPTPTGIVSPSPTASWFCTPAQIRDTIVTQGAAGNVYGNVQIKNISSTSCTIQGNHFLQASFQAKNITIKHQGELGPESITLSPGGVAYSQIHFPNGPQCSGPSTTTPVTFAYMIAPQMTVDFPTAQVTTCVATDQPSQLDVWSISEKPLH